MTPSANKRVPVDPETARDRFRLILMVVAVVLAGLALAVVGGPPRLPGGLPPPRQLVDVLVGSSLPLDTLALVLVDLAWLLWLWIAVSLLLACALVALDVVTGAARWVGGLHGLVDRVSFPMARRVVAAAFAVQVLARGVSVAAAQPLSPTEVELAAQSYQRPSDSTVYASHDEDADPRRTYVVQPGDTLWSIAEREYGSGAAYRCLVRANLGRRMSDGDVFSARGVIRPGWDLLVPTTASLVEEVDGERWYTVRSGDTLRSVAGTLLGDENAWQDLFELNHGTSSGDGKHTLTDPNLIWPGLRLRLPAAVAQSEADVADAADAEPIAPADLTVASAPPPAPSAADLVVAPVAEPAESATIDEAAAPIADVPPDADFGEQELTQTPLLRTPHALYPIALEPADTAGPEAQSAISTGSGDLPVLSGAASGEFPTGPVALGGAGLLGVAGLALGARRLRRLRRLPREPESEVVVEGGFAEAELSADVARRGGRGADTLGAIVARLQQLVEEHHLASVGLVSARHGRSSTTLALAASLAEQPVVFDLSTDFSDRVDADVQAWVSADQDVVLQVSRPRHLRWLPVATQTFQQLPWLLPLGVLYDRQVFHAAWERMGHVLIASLPGHGADTILTSLVATLTAHRSPDQLRIWMVAQPRDLPAPLFDLPHIVRSVDPTDVSAMQAFVDELRDELNRRAVEKPTYDAIVVVSELATLGTWAQALEMLAGRATAAQLGVSVVAASSQPEQALISPLQSHFSTRMVLRMQDEETSVGLLGLADAAFLGGGGRLLLRIEERETVELYGYQVGNDHLERLVRIMRAAYATPPRTPPAHPTVVPPDAAVEVPVARTDRRPDSVSPPASDTPTGVVEESPVADETLSLIDEASDQRGPDTSSHTVEVGPTDPSSDTRAPIDIACFDGPRITCGSEVLWPRQRVGKGGDAKPWEFLLYLACQRADGVRAEVAMEALWPGGEEANSTHRFRQLRYRLRHAFAAASTPPDGDGVSFERGILRLDPGVVYSDAQEFLELVHAARASSGPAQIEQLERARALYVGDLLAGPGSRVYGWVDERGNSGVTLREHFRSEYRNAMSRLGGAYVADGRLEEALEVYHLLTDLDPTDDRHWSALYQLHAERGDRLGLLREERRLRSTLRDLAADVGQAGDPVAEEPSRDLQEEYSALLDRLRHLETKTAAV